MTGPRDIIIVGAGIGGLSAALALLKSGFSVRIVDQAKELLDAGAGVQISANGAHGLIWLGLESALRETWVEPLGKEIRHWESGATWKLFDLGSVSRAIYGAPYFFIHRGDLHRTLLNAVCALDPTAVRLGASAVRFEESEKGIVLECSNGDFFEGQGLIAADGVHSHIRNVAFGDSPECFMGLMAWRGLVPMERLPARFREQVGVNWVGPKGHVVHYPVRSGSLLNFVGIVERGDWKRESWTERGTVAEALNDFAGWHDDVLNIIQNVDCPYKWALLGREPLPSWTKGRVTLLGDAAHPTLPMMAQGAIWLSKMESCLHVACKRIRRLVLPSFASSGLDTIARSHWFVRPRTMHADFTIRF